MIITELTYSYPHEAKYSCHPDTYKGNAIEHYSAELVNLAPKVGDVRSWDSHTWKVADIETYEGPPEHECYRAILTMDGSKPQRKPWRDRSMYLIISAAEISMGWPASPKGVPQLGWYDDSLPGWEIVEVYDFEGSSSHHYSSIRVCWCAPVRQPLSLPERELLTSA